LPCAPDRCLPLRISVPILESATNNPNGSRRAFHRLCGQWLWIGVRSLLWVLLGAYFLLAVTVGVVRLLILPNVHQYSDRIARELQAAIGQKVTLGELNAQWRGFHPQLSITDLRIYDNQDAPALALPRIEAMISWRSLLTAELRFSDIAIEGPAVSIRRDAEGHFFVAGMEIKDKHSDGQGFDDWLLRQGEVSISNGSVDWKDDRRNAPPLRLENVAFRLENGLGGTHAFALAATPPPWLASPIDVRGRLDGDLLHELDHWNGTLYAQFSYTDLAGWSPWIDYPFTVRTGRGGLTLWLTLEESRVTEVVADVALEEVRVRLSNQLPALELARLRGRVSALETTIGPHFLSFIWRSTAGYKITGTELSMQSMSGPAIEHVRLAAEWSNNADSRVAQGSASISALDIGTLATVAGAIPLPGRGRQLLGVTSPHGIIRDIVASWSGDYDAPQRYRFAANFIGLGMKAHRDTPGFDHLNGNIELNESGGHLAGVGRQVELEFPSLFPQHPRQQWDELGFDLHWTTGAERPLEIHLTRAEAANSDVTATARGLWRSTARGPGYLELDIALPKAQLKNVYRYVPQLDDMAARWLAESIVAGACSEGQVHVRGDLADFPFDHGGGAATAGGGAAAAGGGATAAGGDFTVSARVADATLRYHSQWPAIEHIDGVLNMRGSRLSFAAAQAVSHGGRITDTTARVSGLAGREAELEVIGKADGETADFLRFVADTPLRASVGAATAGIKADGRGHLDLKLTVPLAHSGDVQVAGAYQAINNRFVFSGGAPPMSQLNGRFDFTERTVNARATAQMLGGATTLTLTGHGEQGVAVAAQGTVGMAAVVQAYPFPYADRVQGQTSYAANLQAGPRGWQISVDSSLQGVTVDLPAPLAKSADEAVVFHLEQDSTPAADASADRNLLKVSVPHLLSVAARLRDGGRLERAAVGLGEAKAVLPERSVITVAAAFKSIDIDRLMPALASHPQDGPAAVPIGELTLQAPEMVVFGRRFSTVAVRAEPHADHWSIRIGSDQASGKVTWKSDGLGQVNGHFNHLEVPEAVPAAAGGTSRRKLPSMDVTADSFSVAHRDLGRLTLAAANDSSGWRISEFSLASPEGTLHGVGLWQSTAAADRFEADVSIESDDAGKYITRLGQPGAVKGAKADLKGHLSWNGPPYSVDYPTLSGNLALHAERGQFLKADPGVGRLLGVLSLQSIPRRISLDFQDVFSDGFAFDRIEATGAIDRGILTIRDFRMAGPAAAVSLTGEVDLAHETQNLRAHIVPVIGDGIAAAAGLALLNPVVGLGTLIAQRLFKDPLGKLFAYEYDVTGTWSDPKVARAGSAALRTTDTGSPEMEAPPAGGTPLQTQSGPPGASTNPADAADPAAGPSTAPPVAPPDQ